jgi:hypothetical protein
MDDEQYKSRLEEMADKGLTGEGFTMEEADDIYAAHKPYVWESPEHRQKYLEWLRAASQRRQ